MVGADTQRLKEISSKEFTQPLIIDSIPRQSKEQVLEGTELAEIPLGSSQIEDLRLAASKLRGAARRSFQAEMSVKYCDGNARLAERVFGWGRVNVEVGLAERRSGIVCVGAQAGYSGSLRWEEQQPEAAAVLNKTPRLQAPSPIPD